MMNNVGMINVLIIDEKQIFRKMTIFVLSNPKNTGM